MSGELAPRVALGSDHAGYELKQHLAEHLGKLGVAVEDMGVYTSESADYPEPAHAVANAIENGSAEFGVLVCGSGNGVNMVANKHLGVRSAIAWNREVAELARQHNNANVLALPARFIEHKEALAALDAFLAAKFEGGRHQRRVSKIEP
ncbi:MAG: ribose 5-phosphate isomerase B [Flavobacteriales bacterium]|nr:ribose 5-phosphate isomerase B [Flavobacteriales bacterium]